MAGEGEYQTAFYEREGVSSGRSAAVLVPLLRGLIRPKSVLDVGCGVGSFLVEFQREGISEVIGVEGDWAKGVPLALPIDRFRFEDLNQGFDLGRRFDLAVCLEVAEHIEPENADRVVETLTQHAPVIAFSAAVPSQGGTHHVNLQWPEYWARKFRRKGYAAFDPIRPRVLKDDRVAVYYAQNLIVYARPESPAYARLESEGSPVRGRVPFVIRDRAHPLAARVLNHIPSQMREAIYVRYRERWKQHMPGPMKEYH